MSWLLFVDESGQDHRESPYEVLAGIGVEDRQLWSLIQAIGKAQEDCFGNRRYQQEDDEAKAKRILKRKTFRLAAQSGPIPLSERRDLACKALTDGAHVVGNQLAALAQAKVDYVGRVLKLCQEHQCKAFASIIPKSAQYSDRWESSEVASTALRKDYAYLFERFYHFLNVQQSGQMGIVIFDELEKSKSHLLVRQMGEYFLRTKNGRDRASLIIPEPMFVHSDLTTMIQVADLVAYIVSWGVRLPGMTEPPREELATLAGEVVKLRYRHQTPGEHGMWGFKLITSLIPTTTK